MNRVATATASAIRRRLGARQTRPESPPAARRGQGQSLVEFALTLPVVMLILLFGLDFGRVFLGWVTLNNAVREGANYAALNPTAWQGSGNPTLQAEYARLINAESAGINCTLPSPLPAPTFSGGTSIGAPATVSITCGFKLITPFIAAIVGNTVNVTSSATFPVRSGAINGIPVGTTAPIGSAGGSPAPSSAPSAAPSAAPSSAPSAAPTATPVPMCNVPTLTGLKTNKAVSPWTTAGFVANNLLFSPGTPPVYSIATQSLTPGTSVACSSIMTVTK